MRKAAADLESEEAVRLRDEIRRLEADELGIPDAEKRAPVVGHANSGEAWNKDDAVRESQGGTGGEKKPLGRSRISSSAPSEI
jgi:excinuclease ABC subunit B